MQTFGPTVASVLLVTLALDWASASANTPPPSALVLALSLEMPKVAVSVKLPDASTIVVPFPRWLWTGLVVLLPTFVVASANWTSTAPSTSLLPYAETLAIAFDPIATLPPVSHVDVQLPV